MLAEAQTLRKVEAESTIVEFTGGNQMDGLWFYYSKNC